MKEKERLFRFKEFAVRHSRSALPVGIDGVLIGAWADCSGATRILDAGCGCGLIALMFAQRHSKARVIATDIHLPSVEEAAANFAASPWSDRLEARQQDFCEMNTERWGSFDHIVSNPPFFDAGVTDPQASARLSARHAAAFGPETLLRLGAPQLTSTGSIALICPASQREQLLAVAAEVGLHPRRLCEVRGREQHPPKRLLLQASRVPGPCECSSLTIHSIGNEYTDEYRALTGAFYLKF